MLVIIFLFVIKMYKNDGSKISKNSIQNINF